MEEFNGLMETSELEERRDCTSRSTIEMVRSKRHSTKNSRKRRDLRSDRTNSKGKERENSRKFKYERNEKKLCNLSPDCSVYISLVA